MRFCALLCVVLATGCVRDIEVFDAGPRTSSGRGGTTDGGSPGFDGGVKPTDCKQTIADTFEVPSPVGTDRFAGVRWLVFDDIGRLYVLNIIGPAPYTSYVHIFAPAPDHTLIRVIGRGTLGPVQSMAVDAQGHLHVLEYESTGGGGPPEVIELDDMGMLVRRWNPNQQATAWSIAIDSQNRSYIGGFTIDRYDSNRMYVDTIGVEGPQRTQMEIASDIHFGPAGHVWIADIFRNNVHQFDVMTGAHIFEFGGKGNGEPGKFDNQSLAQGDFRGPERMDFDSAGNIYAADPANARVQKLTRQGSFLGAYDFGGSETIGPIAVNPQTGRVYVGRRTTIDIWCPLD